MFRLLLQELRFRRNAIIGWAIGLCFLPMVYIGIYPSVAEEMAGLADLELYAAMGISLGTFPDWVGSILLYLLPIIASIYAVINGTGTLAGEEEDGRLEMIVTLPLPRWQILTAKALALSIATFLIIAVIALVSMGVFISIESQIETDVTAQDMFLSVISTWPVIFAISMLSMFLAAFSANRRIASTITAAYLVTSYFGTNLADSTEVLKPFEPIFLFTYLDATGDAVKSGQAVGDTLVLLGIGAVAFVLALFFFQRRMLTVGIWPWQRVTLPATKS